MGPWDASFSGLLTQFLPHLDTLSRGGGEAFGGFVMEILGRSSLSLSVSLQFCFFRPVVCSLSVFIHFILFLQ